MSHKPKLIAKNEGLVAKNLRWSVSKKPIIRNVSLKVERGTTVGLLGSNGAGKTSSFYALIGLINPDGGEITLDNKDITSLPMYKRARLGISYLPQQPSVFRYLSVEDNILAILETKKYPSDQKQSILEDLLSEFSLSHLRRAMPHTLSGGERRRTEIARCLSSDPKFILMDEPTTGIDPRGIDDIKNIIRQLKKKNISVVISDHNVREVLDICDFSYVMHAGEVVASGNSSEILESREARTFYLGEAFKA